MKKFAVKKISDFVITNDALSRFLFSGKQSGVVNELNDGDNKHKIYSKLMLDSKIILTEFDRAVYDACISAVAAGNKIVTSNIIYRILGGNTKNKISALMGSAIADSLNKMSKIKMTLDCTKAAKKLKYKLKDNYVGKILPLTEITATINGKEGTAFKIDEPVGFTIADVKNQVRRIDLDLFANCPLKCTQRTIAIKHYIFRRVLEIIGSRNNSKARVKLVNVITFADLYQHCHLLKLDHCQRRDVRLIVTQILDYLAAQKIIVGFTFKDELDGVVLDLPPIDSNVVDAAKNKTKTSKAAPYAQTETALLDPDYHVHD